MTGTACVILPDRSVKNEICYFFNSKGLAGSPSSQYRLAVLGLLAQAYLTATGLEMSSFHTLTVFFPVISAFAQTKFFPSAEMEKYSGALPFRVVSPFPVLLKVMSAWS